MSDITVSLEPDVVLNVAASVEESPALTVIASTEDEPDLLVTAEIVEEVLGVVVLGETASPGPSTQTHTQSTPAATWTIPNTPNSRAIVLAVYDDAGRAGLADVYVTDANTSVVFPSPRTGRVDYMRG